MADILFRIPCQLCEGTGIRWYNVSPGGELVSEDPCSICSGDGVRTIGSGIESTYFDEKFNEIMDLLNLIRSELPGAGH